MFSKLTALVVSLIVAFQTPKPTAVAPRTRYHGYELNHAAIQQAKAYTVLISNEGFGGVSRGTGVLLAENLILTCAHVAKNATDMWIYPYPGTEVYHGRVIGVDTIHDLALVLPDRPIHGHTFATFTLKHYDGEPITIIGNTLGSMKWFVSYGIISGEEGPFLLTDGLLKGGNSGGPWVDEQGRIVAITDWTLTDRKGADSGIHGGVSALTIFEFLMTARTVS